MVVEELLHALPLSDPRPGRADPNERKKRKAYEKEHPHFQMQEFGLKAGVLALMAAVAAIPISRKYEEHVAKEHPDRLEKGKGARRRKNEGRDRGWESDGGRDSRRGNGRGSVRGSVDVRSERGEERRRGTSIQESSRSSRQRGYIEDRSRRESVPPVSERSYRSIDDWRRQSVDGRNLRMAVAEGYEYIPPHQGYIEEKGGMDDGWDKRSKRVSLDEYRRKDRRSSVR